MYFIHNLMACVVVSFHNFSNGSVLRAKFFSFLRLFFNLEYTYNNISSYIYKYYNLPNSTMPMHFMRCFRVFSFCFEFLWVVSLAEVCTATTTMHCVINGGKNPLSSSVNANRARSSVVIAATRTWF